MIILAYITIAILVILSIFIKTKVVKCLSLLMALGVAIFTVCGVRTNITIYNVNEDSISFKIRHTEVYNGHNFKRFVSHTSFDKLKDIIQKQHKNSVVLDGVIYVIKNDTIYSISEVKEVRRLGVKCHEYIVNVNYWIIKDNYRSHYVDFPREIISNVDDMTTSATFEEISKIYENFTNATISDDKIVLNKDDEKITISLEGNVVVIKIG